MGPSSGGTSLHNRRRSRRQTRGRGAPPSARHASFLAHWPCIGAQMVDEAAVMIEITSPDAQYLAHSSISARRLAREVLRR
jgi:hypothetical protein